MFICTFDENKKDELINKGFKLICNQNQGDKTLYTYEFNPSFYAFFEKDKKVFISDKMLMA